MRAVLAIVAGGLLLLGVRSAMAVQDAPVAQDAQPDQGGGFGWDAFAGLDFSAVGGVFDTVQSEVSNMVSSVDSALQDRNVQAFLTLIRTGEGTADVLGYSRLFGGKQFQGWADHPRVKVPFGNTYSTAAGAYQILSRTWDEIARQYSLPDFSPQSQDRAAVGLIKRRGALGDVLAGRFSVAIEKCAKEWASLPGSPYGQPTLTLAKAAQVIESQGVAYA